MVSRYVASQFVHSVEIVHDPKDARPWVAIDCRTREPLLRFFNRDRLKQVCLRFGWRIVTVKPRDPRGSAKGHAK
jgi:hypothetical protein